MFIESLEKREMLSATVRAAPPARPSVPAYDHILIVMEENHSYDEIFGAIPKNQPLSHTDPYLRQLATKGAVFTQSYAITHPSQPNYLALFSGSTQGVTTDKAPTTMFTAPNLGGELIAAGDTFAGYNESLPYTGYTGPTVRTYVRHHAPWINFSDVPVSAQKTLSAFPKDYSKLPSVSFVIPDLSYDMHNGSIHDGDSWLKSRLGGYAQWALTHNSLLIVTFDEDDKTQSNRVPTLFYGAHVTPGQYSEHVDDYTILRTIEASFNLKPTGNAATASLITDIFGA